MDIRMPELDGLQATMRIKAFAPHIPVLILTTYEDSNCILGAIRAGAAGYLTKDIDRDELIQTIDATLAGEPTLEAEMTQKLLHWLAQEKAQNHIPYESRITAFHAPGHVPREPAKQEPENCPAPASLTSQELATLKLMSKGLTNAQIAGRLHLSRHTIK